MFDHRLSHKRDTILSKLFTDQALQFGTEQIPVTLCDLGGKGSSRKILTPHKDGNAFLLQRVTMVSIFHEVQSLTHPHFPHPFSPRQSQTNQ